MRLTQRFLTSRMDGRSDTEVVSDLVAAAEPGRVFTHDEIRDALTVGVEGERQITIDTVRGAVARAHGRILRQHARALESIAGIGYRIVEASSHQRLAHRRRKRSDVQLRRGVDVLQHVRWDEMDPNQRAAHEGTLLVMSALYENQRTLERRVRRIDQAIAKLSTQVANE